MVGKTNAKGAGGKSTSFAKNFGDSITSIDVKTVCKDYANLTSGNFIVVPKAGQAYEQLTIGGMKGMYMYANLIDAIVSYNPETGIATITPPVIQNTGTCKRDGYGDYNYNTPVNLGFAVWLVKEEV